MKKQNVARSVCSDNSNQSISFGLLEQSAQDSQSVPADSLRTACRLFSFVFVFHHVARVAQRGVGECFSKASSASTCKNLYRSLPNRLQLCTDNDGAQLPYWAFQRNFLYTIYCLSDVLFFVSLEILFCCWRFLCQMFICCSIFTVVFANWKSAGTRRFLCKGHSICFFFSFFSVEDAVFLLSLSTVKK